MSLINKVLQDLDRRGAIEGTASEARAAVRARPIGTEHPGHEWFWRIVAVLMTVALGWVVWVAWQLYPKPLVTEAAYRAVESALRNPPVRAATGSAPAPQAAAAGHASAAAAPVPPSPAEPAAATSRAILRLAQEISAPPAEPVQAATPPAHPRAEPKPASRATVSETQPPKAAVGERPMQGAAAPAGSRVEKRDRTRTPAEQAESEFRRAATLLGQARVKEAEDALAAALAADPAHDGARQTLAALLLERGALDEARRLLEEGLALSPAHPRFALALARILIERGDHAGALSALARVPPSAESELLRGGALQRLGRHAEAADAYRAAVRDSPENGAAWLGLAISLEALGREPEAAAAYRRAAASGTLAPGARDYAEQRARALQ